MLCISHQNTNPYFNIASEEYLLKNFTDDVFLLYSNEPSIIVGKHQNAFAEINHRFVANNNIKVIRRLSGGGTVFHDLGNLNFCFIRNGQEGNLIDFKRFTQPILEVLHGMGVPSERSGRNDLIINGLKFSGNAEHVYKNRTLHHGTLLFSSKLGNLRDALKVNSELYQDKAVKSVRSQVTNITEHLPSKISLDEFKDLIVKHIVTKSDDASRYELRETDRVKIMELIENKYHTWDWNYGYSPRFAFRNQGTTDQNFFEIKIEVEKGIVKQADIKINNQPKNEIAQAIQGVRYEEGEIMAKLRLLKGLDTSAIGPYLF
jgi:lipoate-protein ligase A